MVPQARMSPHFKNGISIISAIFAVFTIVTNSHAGILLHVLYVALAHIYALGACYVDR